jgi:hypothetical protein
MAQDYFTTSNAFYSTADGSLTGSFTTNSNIGGTATDDNSWDVNDPMQDGFTLLYQGSFTANGHLFLVFQVIGGSTQIRSPTAPANDPGYPANVSAIPALNTASLAYCFCAGSEIATPTGATVVEDLKIGDEILSADGRTIKVKWIGRQTLCKTSHGAHIQPVRIRVGALGNDLPLKDLCVTADHGIVIDGYMVNAAVLVNGDTIDFVPMDELPYAFQVYHVETEDHDVVLANGVPSETFVDAATRTHFDNYDEFLDLYGTDRLIPKMPGVRVSSRRLLPPHLRERLDLSDWEEPTLQTA